MLETEQEQFEEPEYPAFPVIFQRELEEFDKGIQQLEPAAAEQKGSFATAQAASLLALSEKVYETKYPHLFTQKVENSPRGIQDFLEQYTPIDEALVSEIRKGIEDLVLIRLGSNKIYLGQWLDGQCHGKSIMIFKNGDLYEGQMLNSKRHGTGTFVQANVGWYKGGFLEDVKSGPGLEVIYHQNAYQGNFIGGLRHDLGLYVDSDRNVYQGSWKLGIMHGKGSLDTKNSTYTGMFVNWLKHGTGEQHFLNGDIYRGEYSNGRFDGIGTYDWKADGASYEGNFKNGLRHGKGKWSKGEARYIGGYYEGLKQGYGELYFPSGNFYKGNFIQDQRQGYGEFFWTDSSFYKGEWSHGTQHGKGQIFLVGADIIGGVFDNGMLIQVIPSMYQKQTEISNSSIHDVFSNREKLDSSTRTKTFSESKGMHPRKRLSRIQESVSRRKGHNAIHGNMYFRSPDRSDHSHGGRECKCARRFENFRLKQQKKANLNHSPMQDNPRATHPVRRRDI